MNKLLSSQEMSLLLGQMSDLEKEFNEDESSDITEVIPYNLASRERVVRGRMPTLEIVHDRFTRFFRQTLSSHLRTPINMVVRATEVVNYKDFIQGIAQPASVNLYRMQPLQGSALLVLEQTLVYTLVDLLFGGTGNPNAQRPRREFTQIELRLVEKIVNSALEDLQKAWKPIVPLQLQLTRSETNPLMANLVTHNEPVIMTTFDVVIHHVPLTLTLGTLASMYSPIKARLNSGYQSEQSEKNRGVLERLEEKVSKTSVEVRAVLGHTKMSLRKLLQLQVGDHIPLSQEVSKPLNVYVQQQLKLKGFQGVYHGNHAVKVEELVYEPRSPDDWLEQLDDTAE